MIRRWERAQHNISLNREARPLWDKRRCRCRFVVEREKLSSSTRKPRRTRLGLFWALFIFRFSRSYRQVGWRKPSLWLGFGPFNPVLRFLKYLGFAFNNLLSTLTLRIESIQNRVKSE